MAAPEEREWEARALELKGEGYTAAVVARKLIEQHGAPVEEAQALVGRLFGRPVDAFAGETTTRIVTGLGLAALGLVGLLVVFSVDWLDGRFLVFPAALGAEGLRRAFFAFVNRNVKPTER